MKRRVSGTTKRRSTRAKKLKDVRLRSESKLKIRKDVEKAYRKVQKRTKTQVRILVSIGLLLVILLILSAVYYLYSSYNLHRQDKAISSNLDQEEIETSQKECEEGDTKDCITENYCVGTKTCTNGRWSKCLIKPMECSPGSKRRCPKSYCEWGVQTCTQCGQWGPCN